MLGNGFLPMFTQTGVALPAWTGATWAMSGGNTYNVPTLGSELMTNGGLESSFSGGLGSGWFKTGEPTTTQETALVRSGANSQKAITTTFAYNRVDGVGNYAAPPARQWIMAQTFVWVQAGEVRAIVAGSLGYSATVSAAGWSSVSATFRSSEGPFFGHYIRQEGETPATFYIDDASLKAISLPTLFATITGASSSQTVAAKIAALTTGIQSGVVALLDSASNPQNFLIAYHDGTSVLLDKCVAGVYTNLITATVAFTANAQIEIRRPSGNTFQLWYNGVQRGTDQTVSDAGIISNTRYGLFSTHSGGTFSEFSLGGVVIPFNLPGA